MSKTGERGKERELSESKNGVTLTMEVFGLQGSKKDPSQKAKSWD